MKDKSRKESKSRKLVAVQPAKGKTVRLADIAERVGVAVSTVSRILNGTPNSVRVTDKTRKRVLDTAAELGYASHHIPVKLHKGVRSLMILSHEPGETFYQKIISAVERTVRTQGYACYFGYTEGDPDQAGEFIDSMAERFTAGCIVFQRRDEAFAGGNGTKLENLGIPCVLVDHHPLPCPSFVSTVELDNEQAGYDVASHLLQLGHRHFAFLNELSLSSCVERRTGIERRLAEAGLELDEQFVATVSPHERFQLFDAFDSWASNGRPFPTAIITVNDLVGYAALNVLEGRGLCVPEDVSIASFDDRAGLVPWGVDNVRIPLTSLRQPIEFIGRAAGGELIRRIRDPLLEPAHIRMPGDLMIRGSTAAPKAPLVVVRDGIEAVKV